MFISYIFEGVKPTLYISVKGLVDAKMQLQMESDQDIKQYVLQK